MINMNSPTIQNMLKNTPQGFGNMPAYFGNSLNVERGAETPFPSPREMIINNGANNIYGAYPTQQMYTTNNYYPANSMFAGYSNPYMSANPYMETMNPYIGGSMPIGFTGGMIQPQDQDARERLEIANFNGVTYEEQLENESKLYKTLSSIVSKNVGRNEEESAKCQEAFSIYCKTPKPETIYEKRPVVFLHIQIKRGDEVIADIAPEKTVSKLKYTNYSRNSVFVERMKYMAEMMQIERVNKNNMLFAQAPERAFDNMDLLDFFNNGAGVLMADTLSKKLRAQTYSLAGQIYNKDDFRKRLLNSNGLKSKDQLNAMERFTGRYGIMPDGRPVSPGHDPSIASSFSYNPATGQYDVTPPNFLKTKLDLARESFIKSIS